MFKVGEKIVCINNTVNDNDWQSNLTIGKQYVVMSVDMSIIPSKKEVVVKNNEGIISSYYNSRFISVTEYRKLKLEKICSKLEI